MSVIFLGKKKNPLGISDIKLLYTAINAPSSGSLILPRKIHRKGSRGKALSPPAGLFYMQETDSEGVGKLCRVKDKIITCLMITFHLYPNDAGFSRKLLMTKQDIKKKKKEKTLLEWISDRFASKKLQRFSLFFFFSQKISTRCMRPQEITQKFF